MDDSSGFLPELLDPVVSEGSGDAAKEFSATDPVDVPDGVDRVEPADEDDVDSADPADEDGVD
ncbi:hypothetical protein AGMMS50267_09510 [Spirochaetia bacterium]|nr:hypothetical protein AGMMS50267_09510 [Spirochaetia bacterium]